MRPFVLMEERAKKRRMAAWLKLIDQFSGEDPPRIVFSVLGRRLFVVIVIVVVVSAAAAAADAAAVVLVVVPARAGAGTGTGE